MAIAKLVSMFEPMAKRRGQRTGSLINRSGSWLLRYYVDGTEIDPETLKLKRDRITVTIAPSVGAGKKCKREAQRIAWDEWLSKLDQAHTRPSSAKTFMEFVNQRYSPDVVEFMKPSTKAFAHSILRKHVLPFLGNISLREITPAHVQAIINAKSKQNLSPQTLTHIRNRIGAVLRHARAHGWFFGEIPTVAVRLPEMQREERRAMTWQQVCALSRMLPEPCATLILFLTLTGLRIGEAMGLRWSRLNLTMEPMIVDGVTLPPMAMWIKESYVMGKYQTLKPSRSGKRIIPIPEWFAPRLAALSTSGGNKHLPREILTHAPVFANASGRVPIDQHNEAARKLKPAAAKLGMPWVSWHVFRHTHSTLTDQLDLTMAERMKILGHSSAAVTMQYTHPDLKRIRLQLETMVDPKTLN